MEEFIEALTAILQVSIEAFKAILEALQIVLGM